MIFQLCPGPEDKFKSLFSRIYPRSVLAVLLDCSEEIVDVVFATEHLFKVVQVDSVATEEVGNKEDDAKNMKAT